MSRSNHKRPGEVIRDPNWTFPWGKWKGETLCEVLWCDPGYIEWLMANTDFDVHQDLLDTVDERLHAGQKLLYSAKEVSEVLNSEAVDQPK